ncbi:hypothetical protein IAI13_34300, partial [Escherichia coli]|nr:hypothetical protein [Escherichia coli]
AEIVGIRNHIAHARTLRGAALRTCVLCELVEHAGVVAALIARTDITHRRRQARLNRRLRAGQRRGLIAAQISRR